MRAPLLHLYFVLTLFANFGLLMDAHALSNQCMRRLFVNQYEASVPVGVDVGVIDIGSSTVKLFLKKADGEVVAKSYVIELGKSLGKSGSVDGAAFDGLKSALDQAKQEFKKHNFSAQNMDIVATAGLRDAKNGAQIVNKLKRSGYPVRILSEHEEASLVYRSVTRNQLPTWQNAAVIEVGGGSTEVAFGKSFLDLDLEKTAVIPAGSGSLAIRNPFEIADITKAAKKTRGLLRKTSAPAMSAAEEKTFIGRGFPMRVLRDLHLAHTGEDIFETGISREFLDEYLSQGGLDNLKRATVNPVSSQNAEVISQIPSKLVVLREVMEHYRIPSLQFGSAGGMKEALYRELEAKIVGKQIDKVTQQMGKRWEKAEVTFSDKMAELFDPEKFGKWEFRVKQTNSVESKLTNKWVKGTATMSKLKNTTSALEYIGDGIGGRLTLEHAGVKEVDQFYSQMIQAIRNKDLRVTEIHNYRAPGGSPYLADAQAEEMARVIQETTGVRPVIKNGVEAEKPSGYTGLHFNLTDKKGIQFEIQVRGQQVSTLAEYEHRFYDLRQGKSVPDADPKLVHALANLNEEQEKALMEYIRDYYEYARKFERGEHLGAPPFPSALHKYPVLSLYGAFNPKVPH